MCRSFDKQIDTVAMEHEPFAGTRIQPVYMLEELPKFGRTSTN